MSTTQTHKAIGDTISFRTLSPSHSGACNLCGKVVARNWSFSTLLSYTVETLAGRRYNVNANTFEAGHSF
jgi:hypothetical protein